jgi:sugar phosphate isomerase/epimerase
MGHPLSLHHLTMLDASPTELVGAALAAGYDHAGLRVVSPDDGKPFGDLVDSGRARRELLAQAVDLPGGILDVEAVWLRSRTEVEDLVPALSAAQEIGARYVLTVGHDSDRRRVVDKMGRLAELAASFDLRLAVEPITYCGVNDLRSARAVVEELGRDDVFVLVDALQFFRAGLGMEELMRTPRNLLPYAQIADGPRVAPVGPNALREEARTSRLVPGTGDFDLSGWVAALPPGIPLAVEVPSRAVRGLPRAEAARMLRAAVRRVIGPDA